MTDNETNIPSSMYLECDQCGETLHKVLKGRMWGTRLKIVLKCNVCGKVIEKQLERSIQKKVPIIISWLSDSMKEEIILGGADTVRLDDELVVGDTNVLVTGIESHGKRVGKSIAREIDTIWAKKFDMIPIKVSIYSKKGKVKSLMFLSPPGEIISIGDIIKLERSEYFIYSIKKEGGPIRKGSVKARDIVRIYVKYVNSR